MDPQTLTADSTGGHKTAFWGWEQEAQTSRGWKQEAQTSRGWEQEAQTSRGWKQEAQTSRAVEQKWPNTKRNTD